MEDLEYIDAKQNVLEKMQDCRENRFKPSLNTNITLGGNFANTTYRDYIYGYSLFNPSNNPETEEQSWRVFGRSNKVLEPQVMSSLLYLEKCILYFASRLF